MPPGWSLYTNIWMCDVDIQPDTSFIDWRWNAALFRTIAIRTATRISRTWHHCPLSSAKAAPSDSRSPRMSSRLISPRSFVRLLLLQPRSSSKCDPPMSLWHTLALFECVYFEPHSIVFVGNVCTYVYQSFRSQIFPICSCSCETTL